MHLRQRAWGGFVKQGLICAWVAALRRVLPFSADRGTLMQEQTLDCDNYKVFVSMFFHVIKVELSGSISSARLIA